MKTANVGSHVSATCVRDGRPTADGHACVGCRDRAAGQLAEIIDLTPAARAVAYGLARRSGDGGSTGKPGSRSPGNDDAMDALDAIQNALTTLAREIAETRGLEIDSAGLGGSGVPDPLAEACSWLTGQTEWLRHAVDGSEPYALRAYDEIGDCARRIRAVTDGPRAKKYLGPCGASLCVDHDPGDPPCTVTATCEGDVYGPAGGKSGRCRTCGAEVDQGERRAWLDEQARSTDLAWTAIGIADALGINVKTLRAWANERRAPNGTLLRRARLATYWHNGEQLVPWVDLRPGEDVKARGDRLHYVGDVIQLAKEAADRRAEKEQKEALVAS